MNAKTNKGNAVAVVAQNRTRGRRRAALEAAPEAAPREEDHEQEPAALHEHGDEGGAQAEEEPPPETSTVGRSRESRHTLTCEIYKEDHKVLANFKKRHGIAPKDVINLALRSYKYKKGDKITTILPRTKKYKEINMEKYKRRHLHQPCTSPNNRSSSSSSSSSHHVDDSSDDSEDAATR